MPDTQDLIRLGRRCWVPASTRDDLLESAAAVLATSAADPVVSSLTAARLYGFWLPDTIDERIHIATATPARAGRAMSRSKRPEFVAHRLQLEPQDVASYEGLPITSMARTWRDLASVLSLADLVAAGDSALRSEVPFDDLAGVVARTGGSRGARVARLALTLLDRRSRSRPESHLRVIVHTAGAPRFQVNEAIYWDEGGWLAEPDLSLPEAKLALEYQGKDHAELRRMRKDLTRGMDLRGSGWLCLPYGPAEVFRRPWTVAAEVMGEVRRNAPHLLRRPSPRVGR